MVPWGRSLDEYVAMFSLSEGDLKKRILGCGDGPASFNAELTAQGGRVLSVDPIFHFSQEKIRQRIDATYEEVMEQTRNNQHEFIWQYIRTIDELGRIRTAAMNRFLEDYPLGTTEERYREGELPLLPFQDKAFDIALCSHFLFLYSEQFSLEFHLQSLTELCRVASEVRVFPLLEFGAKESRHVQGVRDHLGENGYACSIEEVPYEFQKGGNKMMRVVSC